MDTKILGPGFVVEFSGVNLADPLLQAEFNTIRQSWLDNKVAVFRNQNLTDEELLRFTELFGPLLVHVRSQFNDKSQPGIMLI